MRAAGEKETEREGDACQTSAALGQQARHASTMHRLGAGKQDPAAMKEALKIHTTSAEDTTINQDGDMCLVLENGSARQREQEQQRQTVAAAEAEKRACNDPEVRTKSSLQREARERERGLT